MKELIGKKIKEMYVNENQSFLKFVCEDVDLIYQVEGDCCSESWFADIIFGRNQNFFNHEVKNVEELETPAWLNGVIARDGRSRQEYDEVYGFRLSTSRTTCDIVFRNSSNGYYGGWCSLVEDVNQKWVKTTLDNTTWQQVTDDWSA